MTGGGEVEAKEQEPHRALALALDRPLVVFDIESTGVNARQDRIIELAAVKVMPDGSEVEKDWLLNPGVPIPPETTAIHGITDEIVASCPTFADCAREIYAFFDGCDLSGFNADRFDIPCLEEEFARLGINFAASRRRHVDVHAYTTARSRATSPPPCASTAAATTGGRTARRPMPARRSTC